MHEQPRIDSQDTTEEEQILGPRGGCPAVIAIMFACSASVCSLMQFTLARTPFGSAEPSPITDILQNPVVAVLAAITLTTLPFALVIVPCFYSIVRPALPENARKRWSTITFVGGLGYAVTIWCAFFLLRAYPLGAADGRLLATENDAVAQTLVVLQIGLAGALLGLASGIPLGLSQWVGLREHTERARRWAVTVVVSNTLLVGSLLGLYLWAVRWGWG